MIKDQEALAIWMAKRSQLNRAREISRQAQERLDRSAGSISLDWIANHRPMGQGMSFNGEEPYRLNRPAKIIKSAR